MAVYDALDDPRGDKAAVLRTALDTHVPQVIISTASATYGFVGLMLGTFLAEALISVVAALVRRRDRRSRIVR